MSSTSIRVGLVGAGNNTRQMHIPKLQEIEGVEIAAVCNRSEESGRAVAEAFNIPRVETNWKAMIADPAIDAIMIGTWPNMHCELSCAALEAGKHVLCEARMAMDATEARCMLETAQRHPGQVAQVVPSPFTLAFDRTIQRLLEEDYLGDVLALSVRGLSGDFVDPETPLTWRQDKTLSGLNVLTMGIWYEAMARWIGHAASVMAMTRVFVNERPDGQGGRVPVSVPDHVDILAQMQCGAQAHLHFSAVTGLAPNPMDVFLYGSEGTLHLDVMRNTLYGGKRGMSLKKIDIPPGDKGHWQVEAEFVSAIRGEGPIELTTFEEGVHYMVFTEAVAQSAAEGRRVELAKI